MAVLASGVTLGVVALLAQVLPFEPFLLFAVPVVLTSRYAGRGPTALAILLSVVGIELTLLVSPIPLRHSAGELWLHAALFGIVALSIDSSTEALRRARRDAERSSERLEDVNLELEQQMEEVQVLSEDLQLTNQSLAEARDVAEEASRARAEMLAIVAHDLRNPLNVVMMATELFREIDPSAEKRDQLLGAVRRATRRMNRLIEDLLEVVRQESGQMTLDVHDVPVASLTAQTVEMFQSTAVEKGVSLRVHEPPPDLAVKVDSERVMQVLSNLVGNALKFVPRGGSVAINCEDRGTEALFSVIDSGPGIAPDDLDRLFEKFWQRRRTDRRGVGLGLTIARGIVDAHGGRIWAESQLGIGSTFYFTLPAANQPSTDLPAIERASKPLEALMPA